VKICIVSSCGGHLTEVRAFKSLYFNFSHFYVINSRIILPEDMLPRTKFIKHSSRDFFFLIKLIEAFFILRRERPSIIFSTGASPVVPFALVGRLFFNCKVIFIESITRVVKPSLTGRIMYWLAHDFYYQSKDLVNYFPKGRYKGQII